MITTNERAVRMIEDTPAYYHYSKVYNGLQEANAVELDLINETNKEIAIQLDPKTATWGLTFWEERLGLPILSSSDDYNQRRKKVLARIRAGAPFSAAMVKAVVEAYTEKPVRVAFDIPNGQVKIFFNREFNATAELFTAIDNIIHAHLGFDFSGEWVYEDALGYSWEYKAFKYPFTLFANTALTGTTPAGTYTPLTAGVPSTLGRLIEAAVEMTQSTYYTRPQAMKFAYGVLAGGTEVANNGKAYSDTTEAAAEFARTTKAYKLCGIPYAGTGVLI